MISQTVAVREIHARILPMAHNPRVDAPLEGPQLDRADARRALAELELLRERTGSDTGAQRLAWTQTWAQARAWLVSELHELPVAINTDAAGNLWATLAGAGPRALVIGSHLDSVPDGGWLDGCLGVIAALEILRSLARGPRPALTVRLVDWADEEGARFGRSLFGSSAAAGLLVPDDLRHASDADGVTLPEALARHGVSLEEAPAAAIDPRETVAYLELHIEQGPALEDAGVALGVVDGVFGVERHRIEFEGRASHAGATPMALRRDPLAAASRLVLAARESAVKAGGVATVGEIEVHPSIPTAIPATALLTLDQRHGQQSVLSAMLDDAAAAADAIAAQERVTARWSPIQRIDPVRFDSGLVASAEESVRAITGNCLRVTSGALHDAAMMARAGVPSVMLFVQSIGGISHNRIEDSRPEHIEQGVAALDRLARRVLRDAGDPAVRDWLGPCALWRRE
jgi:hydantoinase/carbamoylase family amidase